jgi:hypothetical protein
MGDARIILALAACATLAGCVTTAPGQVQEVGSGTYSIAVGRSHALAQSAEDMKIAVDKAGEYCHSKAQKLLVTPSTGNIVTFRCVAPDNEVAPASAANDQRAH